MGSGMSSRLFREVREERGLAYAIYGFKLSYSDNGAWGVHVGTTPNQTDTALTVIREDLAKVVEEGPRGVGAGQGLDAWWPRIGAGGCQQPHGPSRP